VSRKHHPEMRRSSRTEQPVGVFSQAPCRSAYRNHSHSPIARTRRQHLGPAVVDLTIEEISREFESEPRRATLRRFGASSYRYAQTGPPVFPGSTPMRDRRPTSFRAYNSNAVFTIRPTWKAPGRSRVPVRLSTVPRLWPRRWCGTKCRGDLPPLHCPRARVGRCARRTHRWSGAG